MPPRSASLVQPSPALPGAAPAMPSPRVRSLQVTVVAADDTVVACATEDRVVHAWALRDFRSVFHTKIPVEGTVYQIVLGKVSCRRLSRSFVCPAHSLPTELPPPPPQGCMRREGTSEAAPEAVRQAVGGGC